MSFSKLHHTYSHTNINIVLKEMRGKTDLEAHC